MTRTLEYEWEMEAPVQWELDTAAVEFDIIGRDDRVKVTDTRAIPFRHICKLEMVYPDGNYMCTGTLIAPNKVLTAGHCVFDSTHGGRARSIRVIPGKNGPGRTPREEPFGSAMATRLNFRREWETASRAFSPFDYGVITLSRPIGNLGGLGWWRKIAYQPDSFLLKNKVNTAGYPGDKGGNHQYKVYDRDVTVMPQRMEFLNDVMGGQSGSPIWIRWQNTRIIVGIVTTHDDPSTRVRANTGVRITPSILNDIKTWVTR